MKWRDVMQAIGDVLNTKLVEVGGRAVTPTTVIISVVIIIGAFVLSEMVQRALVRGLRGRGVDTAHGTGAMGRLLHYAFVTVGFAVALQTAGIELSALFAAGCGVCRWHRVCDAEHRAKLRVGRDLAGGALDPPWRHIGHRR